MRRARILVAALLAAPQLACAVEPSAPPPAAADAAPATSAVAGESTRSIRARFDCDDGQAIDIRFFPQQGVAVLVEDGRTHELQQQIVGSGYWYTNGPIGVRGKGSELKLEIGRRTPVSCRERGGG